MSAFEEYIAEIEERKAQGLHPKPIDDSALLSEIIAQIKDVDHAHREDSLKFFIYNTLPGTTAAAREKAFFLKEIILGQADVPEITPTFAFELLSHMKGGPSVEVLLDLALGDDAEIAADEKAMAEGKDKKNQCEIDKADAEAALVDLTKELAEKDLGRGKHHACNLPQTMNKQ